MFSYFKRSLKHGCSFLALGAGLAFAAPLVEAAPQPLDEARPYQNGWGFDQSGMKLNILPGNDFYNFANGTYIDHLKIPDDMSSYGAFHILAELSLSRQKSLLEKAASTSNASSSEMEKLGVYYASFMDQDKIDHLGIQPLNPDLIRLKALTSRNDIAKIFGEAAHSLMFSTFAVDIEQDQRDPSRYMLLIDQGMSIGVSGGLGLPDISYYTDPKLADKKKAYQDYISHMLALANWPDPEKNAAAILALETKLARVELPRDQTRDPIKTFNPMTVSQLKKLAPKFDWDMLLTSMGIPKKDLDKREIDVREPKAIAAMSDVLAQTDMPTLKSWLAFHLIDNAAPYLSQNFAKASFDFNGKTLLGIKEQPVRWKRAVRATNEAMGWALGRLYVKEYFPASAKEQITAMAENLKSAFKKRLERNRWMDETTRKAALNKLDHFAIQVGYPVKWWDYSKLSVQKNDVYGNVKRAAVFNWQHRLERLDRPVDRDEWDMTPQTVNAYNNPTMNEVVFPAAILQPPFFDPKGDMAVNFGAIGGVIGHEMSHGFDDQGRHFDETGRLHDWWTKKSADAFDKLAQRLGKEYAAPEILPGLHVNPTMTMGENIADLGGLNLALQAYQESAHNKNPDIRHGLTGIQRVYLGWAQVWREKDRPDALKRQVLSNEHSPAILRVNIPVRNIDSWYSAFGVKPDQKLYLPKTERVTIW
ncbi:peptidase M13 [Aristophania vespae]|uniref:Peptidase M13 n=1 Tax=Aristophania vespae TaxID=2697033 RepID=A0A6P1NAC5_9PROT|nr:M13 family metallopeptidase [Aristophania vespae]QHI95605.1 peptidase M13 [Aristophania vespae]UMM63272.1 Neutral endopeptidase [Aristophania vespae]